MANGLDRFNKKWGSSVKRTKKEAKKAADAHIIKETTEKRLATESLEDKMKRTGVTNFETGEVVPYNVANKDDEVWGFINKSFYNKLINDTKENVEMNAEQMKSLLNEVLDAREGNKRKDEIRLAELQLELVREQIKLEELRATNSKPAEFTLEPFMPAKKSIRERANELGIDWDEQQRMSQMVQDFTYVADKEPLPKREAVVKVIVPTEGKLEEIPESSVPDGWSVPVRKGRGGYSVAWKKVIEDDRFLSVIHGIITWAKDQGADIHDTNAFRKFHPVCQGAYVQCTKVYPGKGSWNSVLARFGF